MKKLFTLLTALLLAATTAFAAEITTGVIISSATFSVDGVTLSAAADVVRGSVVAYTLALTDVGEGDQVQAWQLGTTAGGAADWVNQTSSAHTLTAGATSVSGSFIVNATGDFCLGSFRVIQKVGGGAADWAVANDLAVNWIESQGAIVLQDSVMSVVTDKHAAATDSYLVGGEYDVTETITLTFTYIAQSGAQEIRYAFKNLDNTANIFTNGALNYFTLACPQSAVETTITAEVEIPDDATLDTCIISSWMQPWSVDVHYVRDTILLKDIPVATEEAIEATEAIVYPNPSTGVVTFASAASVYTLSGVLVKEVEAGTTDLESGVYIVKAGAESTKLIVE